MDTCTGMLTYNVLGLAVWLGREGSSGIYVRTSRTWMEVKRGPPHLFSGLTSSVVLDKSHVVAGVSAADFLREGH